MFIFSEVSEEKLYTQSAVNDILSENRELKQENAELQRKVKNLTQGFVDYSSFCRENGAVQCKIVMDENGWRINILNTESNEIESFDWRKLRERIKELEKENKILSDENEVLKRDNEILTANDGRPMYKELLANTTGEARELFVRNLFYNLKCVPINQKCDCGESEKKIEELQSQIADMTEQYDSLRDEYETACLEREHLVKQLIQEKKEHNETFRKLIGALNAWGFSKERLNQEMEKQNEQRRIFKTTRARHKAGRRKLR